MTRCVLAFDTSTALTCVAVTRAGELLSQASAPSGDRHAQALLPRVEQCLQDAGLSLADIDVFVVGIGPGSFTGVRVGLATAKGFALATGKPLRAVESLSVLARPALGVGKSGLVAPLLDGHKGELFAALFEGDASAPRVLVPAFNATPLLALQRVASLAAGRPLQLLGSGLRRYARELEPELAAVHASVLDASFDSPSPRELAAEGERLLDLEGASDLVSLVPIYLRDSDAQLPKAPLRL